MSATLDTARFAAYFAGLAGLPGGKTPVLHIPGRTFPVRDLYLEDALAATGHRPRLKRKIGGWVGGWVSGWLLFPMYGRIPCTFWSGS